jgi:hypothetical protein
MFAYKVSHSVRDFMPNFTSIYSPFVVRVRPGKRQEENTGKKANKILSLKNPSIMGLSSASSSTNSTRSVNNREKLNENVLYCFCYQKIIYLLFINFSSESEYSSSEELSSSMASSNLGPMGSRSQNQQGEFSFSKLFPTMKDSYGVEIKSPRKSDILLYKRYGMD